MGVEVARSCKVLGICGQMKHSDATIQLYLHLDGYRVTSPITKRSFLGPYRRPMPRVLGFSYGGGCFLMSEVPLYSSGFMRASAT